MRTEDSIRAAANREALTDRIEVLTNDLNALRLEKDGAQVQIQQLQIENERMEQEVEMTQREMNMTQQELEEMKTKMQEVFLDPTNDRCKAMCVQSFTYLCSFMFMNLDVRSNRSNAPVGFKKFEGLRLFLLNQFNVDIGRVPPKKEPHGVLGQLRMKVGERLLNLIV